MLSRYSVETDVALELTTLGIRKDLNLVGTNYSTLSSIFYVGWLLWALPGNLIMAKFPLSKYLGLNVSHRFRLMREFVLTA